MSLFNSLATKHLQLNKKQSIVLIIGIILSTALITSVSTLLASFQTSTYEYTKKHYGNYHYEFVNVPLQDLDRLKSNSNVEDLFITQDIGHHIFNDSQKQLDIKLIRVSENTLSKLGIELLEGRMPQNENEIIVSNKTETEENIKPQIGSDIVLTSHNGNTTTYKVVGIANIMNQQIEPRFTSSNSEFFYTFITYLDTNLLNDRLNVYIRCIDLKNRVNTLSDILQIDSKTFEELKEKTISKTETNLIATNSKLYSCIPNPQLISFETESDSDQTSQMLYFIAAIVIFIIIITSVYCIKSSFNIAITERVRLYGILSSIGATSKQIKKSILYEAFLLGVISIPIGIILGIFSVYILLQIVEQCIAKSLFEMDFIFSVNFIAISFAILLSSLTVYWSARKIAKKASRISPMEAIRSNKDIKIKSKKMLSSKFIKKLFGVSGNIAYKNLKRNSRKYRTTVISIIMSVSAFIAMISFTNYGFEVSKLYYKQYDHSIILFGDNYRALEKITQDSNILMSELNRSDWGIVKNAGEHYSDEVKSLVTQNEHKNEMILLESLGNQEYSRFLNKLGLQYENVKDKAILLDYKTDKTMSEENSKFVTFRIFDYTVNDILQLEKDDKSISLEIAAITQETPMGLPSYNGAYLIVSEDFMNQYLILTDSTINSYTLYINASNDKEVENYLKENYSDSYFYMSNISNEEREQKTILMSISIFLYAFIIVTSLVGITNIFNVITTSIELRQKEFAHLKAIGMTNKEFHKMIQLEGIFLGIKSLIIGLLLGIILSFFIHLAFSTNVIIDYILPTNGIIISILAVSILIWCIMRYSFHKINRQNIIETMRKDTI